MNDTIIYHYGVLTTRFVPDGVGIGFFPRAERADRCDDIGLTWSRDRLVVDRLVGVERPPVDHLGDTTPSLAGKHLHVVPPSDPLIGADTVLTWLHLYFMNRNTQYI